MEHNDGSTSPRSCDSGVDIIDHHFNLSYNEQYINDRCTDDFGGAGDDDNDGDGGITDNSNSHNNSNHNGHNEIHIIDENNNVISDSNNNNTIDENDNCNNPDINNNNCTGIDVNNNNNNVNNNNKDQTDDITDTPDLSGKRGSVSRKGKKKFACWKKNFATMVHRNSFSSISSVHQLYYSLFYLR